jgi:hypothetical protein
MKNSADAPSRRPHYEIGYKNVKARLLGNHAVTTITTLYGDYPPEIMAVQETDILATTIRPRDRLKW